MRQTSPAVLAVWALVGLVLGWLLHPLSDRAGTPPVVTWTQVASLAIVAVIVALAAWSTWRTVQVLHERLEPQQAVNRLVLARACAYVGAIMGGGYLGYALSWIGDAGELADERLLRSALAALAGLVVVIAALLLERACRVRKDDPSS
ncbi:MAG: DUF3180 domain-containing protein [Nocardioides sp.]